MNEKNLDDQPKKNSPVSFLSLLISFLSHAHSLSVNKRLPKQQGTIVGLRHYQEPGLKGGGGRGGGRNSGGGGGIPSPDADVLEDLARSMRKAADAAMGSTFGR